MRTIRKKYNLRLRIIRGCKFMVSAHLCWAAVALGHVQTVSWASARAAADDAGLRGPEDGGVI